MAPTRRDFLRTAAVAGVTAPALGTRAGEASAAEAHAQQECPSGKMTHSILERDHPYIYIDSCMQMWRDGDFHLAHRHGVTTSRRGARTPTRRRLSRA